MLIKESGSLGGIPLYDVTQAAVGLGVMVV